jgi:hypothetical protein
MEENQTLSNHDNTIAVQQTYTISEITAIYKKQNNDLLEALEIFTIINYSHYTDQNDINKLKKLNLAFILLTINDLELKTHGESIVTNILNTIFNEALESAEELFECAEPDYWEIKYESIVNIIIKNDVDVSSMLYLFNLLYKSLKAINHLSLYYYFKENTCSGYINSDILSENINFNIVAVEAKKYTNLNERINFYHSEIAAKELICIREDENELINYECREFINKCCKAIEITKNQLEKTVSEQNNHQLTEAPKQEITTAESPGILEGTPNQKNINPAFTTSRQVLAIYYLLNEIDHKGINQIDKTDRAKFIEFLTGKNYNNIYKTLSNPFKGLDKKSPKSFLNDIEYIKMHFENLGLKSIVQKIDADTCQVD